MRADVLQQKLIFLLLFVINILINVDHGAIPAATTILKRDLLLELESMIKTITF